MRIQTPKVEGNWLYKAVNDNRWFTKEAMLPNNTPDLPECTDEEKEQWEEEHKPEPEPQEKEQSVEQPTE